MSDQNQILVFERAESRREIYAIFRQFGALKVAIDYLHYDKFGQNGPKVAGFPRFYRKANYQKFMGPQSKMSDSEKEIFGRVVKTAFYLSRGTFWGQRKREYVHSEYANHGKKSTYCENDFRFVLCYDGEQ